MEEATKTVNRGEAFADFVSGLDYGTIIHYQDIEKVTRERRGTSRYYTSIYKAKSILEDRGKAIKPIGGGDYQVLYPGDYSSAYAREIKCARNRIKHGGKILTGAPVNDMTTAELQIHNRVLDFHNAVEARICGDYVTVKRLSDKRNPLLPERS